MPSILGVCLGTELEGALSPGPGAVELARDPEEALVRLQARPFDVLVIGPGLDDPVGLTQRASTLDRDLSVLIVREPGEHARTLGTLAIAPFVGARVECIATRDGPTLLGRVARAATTTRRARGYRPVAAAVAAASPAPRPAAAAAAPYVDLLRDHASLGVVVLDAGLVVLEANPRARGLLGPGLLGSSLPAALHSVGLGEVLRTCLATSRRAGPERLELGAAVTVELTATPQHAGGPGALAVLVEEVTARVRMERRLARACQCFLAFGADAEANIRRLTDLAGELLGADGALYSRVAAGRLEACASWPAPADADLDRAVAGRLAGEVLVARDDRLVVIGSTTEGGRAYAGRTVRVGPRALGVLGLRLRGGYARDDEDERLIGILAGAIAVEEQRLEAERALRRSEELLARSQRVESMGQLAGGLAHDFNNVLTAVVVNAHLLVDRLPPGPDREAAQGILEAAERASGVTRQLLAFGRKQVLRLAVVDLNDVVRGLRPMLGRLLGERVTTTLALEDGLPAVEADRGQLEQVVVNLCLNARDAMPGGGEVTISTAAVPGTGDVSLAVRDAGVGMDEATLARLFEPFFTTKPGGTGLGLAMVDGIVRQSGGRVRVESQPGRGATFSVLLPGVRRPAAGSLAPRDEPGAGRARTILVVDDQPVVLRAVTATLAHAGHRVLSAAGGAEALELAGALEGPLDLLLTDVEMPGLRGPELAARLTSARPSTRVIYMSGYASTGTDVIAPRAAFIQKPFAPRDLLALVATTLGPAR